MGFIFSYATENKLGKEFCDHFHEVSKLFTLLIKSLAIASSLLASDFLGLQFCTIIELNYKICKIYS